MKIFVMLRMKNFCGAQKGIYVVFSVFVLSCILKLLWSLLQGKTCVESDGVNEYLVNYQGGFVRRGLVGEMLLHLYHWTSCDVGSLVRIVSVVFIMTLGYLLWNMMQKHSLSPMLAIMPVSGISLYFFHFNYAGCRKDPLLLLLVIAAFYCLSYYWKSKNKLYLLFLNIAISLGILLHEAFVLFSFPLVCVSMIGIYQKRNDKIVKALVKTLVTILPSLFVFYVCIRHMGGAEYPERIWNSWHSYFLKFDSIAAATDVFNTLSSSIKSLSWTTDYAVNRHIHVNFLSNSWGIPSWLFWLFYPFAYLHLMMNPNVLKQDEEQGIFDRVLMTKILLLGFICLLPMFTVLSCDFSRTFVFLSVTSISAYCILPHTILKRSYLSLFDGVSRKITSYEKKIEKYRNCNIVFVLFFSIPACGFDLTDALFSSIVGTPIGLIVELFNRIV